MPLFTRELNALADRIGRSDLTIWLHTAAPTEASPTNGRTTVGGAAFENGVVVASGDISTAVNGDITIPGDIDYGTADDDVGTVAWWTAVRGSDEVGYGTLPSTVIADGDSFKINGGTLDFNGSTS